MKRKLLIALLSAMAVTVVASAATTVAYATDDWGTGGWNVPKQRTTWNPDGVWMEGEYYKVDLDNQPDDTVNHWGNENDWVNDFYMGMSWDEEYLYTYFTFQGGCNYSKEVWDGTCIQFGGTDYGKEGNDRLEYGITWNTNIDDNQTILWCDYLGTGYADGTDTDDFVVLFRDGWVIYEMRTPFSAFSTIESIGEGDKVGVCYVICTGSGNYNYAQTQIGYGITGWKNAGDHCPITLTAAPEVEEQETNGYALEFFNLRTGQMWRWLVGKDEKDEETDIYLRDDLMFGLQDMEDFEENFENQYGYDLAGFRLYHTSVPDGITTALWDTIWNRNDTVSVDDVLFDLSTDTEEKYQYVKDYSFVAERDEGYYDTFQFVSVYDPWEYTVKFVDMGNLGEGEVLNERSIWTDHNVWDYKPDEPEAPDGYVFHHWEVLDSNGDCYTIDGEYVTIYYDHWSNVQLDADMIQNCVVNGTLYVRAVHESADAVYHSGTVGEDNIPWQITADGTLTVGTVDGEGSYSIPDWDDPFNNYDWNNWEENDQITTAIAEGKIAPWFPYRDDIKALVIGDDIGYIGNQSFRDLYNIKGNVTIPGSVDVIGEWAFHCNNFASITFEEGVGCISAYAFDCSYELTEIHIPASMYNIDSEAFKECYKVEAFTVDEDSEWHLAIDGVLFNKWMTLMRYPWAKADTSYTVPDGVKMLQACCFENSPNLTSITLPDGLETIEWWALAGLNVTELTIPGSVNSVQDSAFRNCYKLTDIYFQGKKPDALDGNLFWLYDEDSDSDYINENLKIHYNAAAENWGDITGEYGDHIVIDGGYMVRFVDDDGDTNLLDPQYLAIGNSITIPTAETRDYGYFDHWQAWDRDYTLKRRNLTLTQSLLNDAGTDTNWDGINDTIVFEANYNLYDDLEYRAYGEIDNDGDGENEVWWRVTWDRTLEIGSLTDDMVSIPDYPDCYADDDAYRNAERAPWHAYANYIREINWCGVKDYIGSYAFADLYLLNGVSIPGEVKTIGTCAFIGCTNIGWININDGVERIEHDVFCDVDMNNGIWIPASVTYMSDNAFVNCRVNRFEVDSNNENYWNDAQGILYKYNGDGTSTLLAYPKNNGQSAVVIPEGVTTIHERAFEGARDIYSIQLPESLKTIEQYAFRWADNLRVIHIPASVTSIGRDAFEGDYNLQGAYFYGNAPEIEYGATFNNCADNFKVYYLNGKTGFDDIGYETATFSANDNYAEGTINYNWEGEQIDLKWYITKDGWLKVEGNTSIPNHEHPWWEYQAYVRKVDIDDNITYIGNNAFVDLTHVDQINLPKNVKHIGDSAFGGMGSAVDGFRGMNNNIGALVLPAKVESIESSAFRYLGITKVTIPASLENIGVWVFTDNPITTYAVESGSTNFAVDSYGALYELDENGNKVALVAYPRDAEAKSYTVPNGVTKLYGASIRNCDNLTSVTLPDTLQYISNEAFCHSHNLGQLTIPASVTDVETYAFGSGGTPSILFMGNKPTFHDDGEWEGNQFDGWGDDVYTIFYYEGATGWADYTAVRTYELKAGEEPMLVVDHVDNTDIDWTIDKNGVLTVYGEGEIPDHTWEWREFIDTMVKKIHIEEGITGIGQNSFWNDNGGITELTLPSTLKYISMNAFNSNSENGNKFGELVLPEGLERIDYHVFCNCGLTKVTIPSTLTIFDTWAFEKNQVKEYIVADGNPELATDEYGVLFWLWYDEDDNGNRIDGTGRLGALAAYPSGSSMTTYTVPETVGDICSWAFAYANNLTKLNLNHAWGYNNYAIAYCDNLTTLILPENMDWMDPDAIIGNKNLKSITFSGNIPRFNVWDDGKYDPFVDNADDLVIYYYKDAYRVENLDNSGLRNVHTFVELTHTNMKGDVNDDGVVNNDDLKLLQRYFAGYNVTIANLDNADIDGEDGFTRRDVMILARYLANWGGDYSKYFN